MFELQKLLTTYFEIIRKIKSVHHLLLLKEDYEVVFFAYPQDKNHSAS
jgi:hypothetical protein